MAFPTLTRILLLFVFSTSATSEPISPTVAPHITDCFSVNMETFRCRWSRGSYSNRSEPLRLFYLNKPSVVQWLECPQYGPLNECFFSEEHTTVWNSYRVQLRSRDQRTVFDESVFNVYDRVRPDPPYNVSWSALNSSVSGQFYDTLVRWSPPESADVQSGWMRLQYQLQHRDASSNLWKESDVLDSTHCSVYGLSTDVQYEVRVRCKMIAMKFGDFSKSIFIYQPSKVSRFPVASLLIFGALCLVAILMLVLISQQEKLMVLLLPPIPGPKIRGIDPKLLKTMMKVLTEKGMLAQTLEDLGRVLQHSESREKALEEERDSLVATVKQLQQSLEAQCNIRVVNERLENELKEMKKENTKKAEAAEAEVLRHEVELRAAADHHQRALEAVRRQGRRDVDEAHTRAALKMEAQASEAKQQLENMELELEQMRRSLWEEQRDHNSQMLKLQIEFGVKLARVQNAAQMNQQQQQHHSPFQTVNIFKRKLQFFQEEKNKEVAALRQQIKELEEGQLTGAKRRKVLFNI